MTAASKLVNAALFPIRLRLLICSSPAMQQLAPALIAGNLLHRWWYGLFAPAIQPGPKAAVLGDAPELTSFRVAIRPESRPSSKRSAWHPHALGPCRRGAGLRRKLHDYLSFTIEKAQNPPGLSHVSQDVREKGDLR